MSKESYVSHMTENKSNFPVYIYIYMFLLLFSSLENLPGFDVLSMYSSGLSGYEQNKRHE